ncbi:MAG TPA: DUF4252 domain-containing protein [Pyrinomonadaceae bacterium]|jgi:hypothetical protein
MKNFKRSFLQLLTLALLVCGASRAACAQIHYPAQLQIDSLESLATRANQIVDVNLPESMLRLIPISAIKSTDVDVKDLKQIIAGLKGVYVKNFEFNNEGEYTQADIAPIRAQLKAPGWARFVNIINKKEGRNIEVYLMTAPQGARVEGLAILAAEPKQLTVVNIVGIIDIEKLAKLEGQFGIPDLDLEEDKHDEKRPDERKPQVATPATRKP